MAADSLVIKLRRSMTGLIGFACVILVSVIVLYAGLMNRDNFLSSDFEVNFLPSIDLVGVKKTRGRTVPTNLVIKNFRFAAGNPNAVRKPSIFQPGENLFLVFDADGYTSDNGNVWLQEDINVRYPDDSVGLKLENINDFKRKLPDIGPIRFENTLALPENAQAGRYTITITVRDKLSRRELKEQRFFYVTPPEVKKAPPPPPPPKASETIKKTPPPVTKKPAKSPPKAVVSSPPPTKIPPPTPPIRPVSPKKPKKQDLIDMY